MTKQQLENRSKTYKKLEAILSASKLKVVHDMSKIKLEAANNYTLSLFYRNIFEKATDAFGFESEIFENDFKTKEEINIAFVEEKYSLSHGAEKVLRAFENKAKESDLNIIVTDAKHTIEKYKDKYRIVSSENLLSFGHEITHRYVTKKYKRVNVFSSINTNKPFVILPMKELNQNAEYKYDTFFQNEISFTPSLEVVIENAFMNYIKNLMLYFQVYGKYISLKETLIKHEMSIDKLNEKVEELKRETNKLRQSKITAEILMSSEVNND